MKKIGFLSFGHWTPSPQSGTRSAADVLLQSMLAYFFNAGVLALTINVAASLLRP